MRDLWMLVFLPRIVAGPGLADWWLEGYACYVVCPANSLHLLNTLRLFRLFLLVSVFQSMSCTWMPCCFCKSCHTNCRLIRQTTTSRRYCICQHLNAWTQRAFVIVSALSLGDSDSNVNVANAWNFCRSQILGRNLHSIATMSLELA